MSDFNWDDHPVVDRAGTGAGPAVDRDPAKFDWEAHPVGGKAVSKTESAVRGAVQGFPVIGPWADEAAGGLEALWDKAKGDPKAFGELYKQHRDESRANYKNAAETNPKSYYGGLGAGVLASSLPKAIPVVGPALAAGVGAVEGAGASEAEDLPGVGKDAAIMSAISAGTAGLGRMAAPMLSRGINKAGETIGSGAENLAARALGAERGTIKKLGADRVQELGRYGLDNKIVTPLASAEDMASRNAVMKRLGGEKMGKVYDTIDSAGASKFNPVDVASKVETELAPTYKTAINKPEWGQFNNTLESILARGGGNIPLKEAQALKQEIGSVAYPAGRKAIDPTPKQQMAMDAYRIINQSIDEATEKGAKEVGSEGLAELLKEGKSTFGNAKNAEKLLDNRVAREKGNKLFGITDYIAGAGGLGAAVASHGKSAPWLASGLVGKKVAEKYGTASGAVLLNKVSKLLDTAPDKLGKYGPILQKAALRGTSALNTTHQMLMSDPDYRSTIDDAE